MAELAESLHERYAGHTTSAVSKAPEIPGAAMFVKQVGNLVPRCFPAHPMTFSWRYSASVAGDRCLAGYKEPPFQSGNG